MKRNSGKESWRKLRILVRRFGLRLVWHRARLAWGCLNEVADVQIADTRARVWTLLKVTFTGAAILRKRQSGLPGYLD